MKRKENTLKLHQESMHNETVLALPENGSIGAGGTGGTDHVVRGGRAKGLVEHRAEDTVVVGGGVWILEGRRTQLEDLDSLPW